MSVLSQIGIKKGERPGYRQFMYSRWVDADRWLPIPRKCPTSETTKNRFTAKFCHNNIPETFQYGFHGFESFKASCYICKTYTFLNVNVYVVCCLNE